MITKTLFASSVIFSLLSLFAFLGVFSKIPQLPAFIREKSFTPEGGYLPALIFLVSVLPLGIGLFLSEKEAARKMLLGVASVIVGFAVILSLYNILPGKTFAPRFPSYATSWAISVDALKASPILGIGPGNYLTAFNRYRPIEYNATDLWAVKFATARNFIFTLMTESGLLATAGFILLLFAVYKSARQNLKEQKLVNWGFPAIASLVSLTLLTISLFIFPATIMLIGLFFIYLALYSTGKPTSLNLTAQSTQEGTAHNVATRFPALLISIPVIIACIYLTIRSSRIVLAEYTFTKSVNALAKNDAQTTYDTMREAIRINPYVDRYHVVFARINLALANSIALNTQKEGATASEQDRTTITTLVQQAISEGKSTVALNPLRAGNWEVLAQTYRSIMPLAQGADAFSVQSYRQAVALDPLNPNLRIALGGIHYALGDFENAVSIFELAVATKPDHANAHYNLAFALNERGSVDRAIIEMTTVLSLLTDKNSEDFKVAQKALSDMQAKKKAQAPAGEQLTTPQGEQGPSLEPPLELPEGSEPPEAVLTPTPSTAQEVVNSPSLTPTGSPTQAP